MKVRESVKTELVINGRTIGAGERPFIVAEIGINHEGDMAKAKRMIDEAARVGAECVKFQCHVIEDEMVPAAQEAIPGHVKESIWDIMVRCSFSEAQDRELKEYTESKGMLYLSTPFSRAAADRLESLGVAAYKIGSGECNNYPLIEHIAAFGKPVILSTGMNDIASIRPAVAILRGTGVPFALLHCTSMYPTPYNRIRLGAMLELQQAFPDAKIGLSDHAAGNYASFGAVALGASIVERHFTADKVWPGPDIPLSMDPAELADLIDGCNAVFESLGGSKAILPEEQPTINFAYACVVATRDVAPGEELTPDNTWVKRPGTGEILAREYPKVLGKKAQIGIKQNQQLKWEWLK
jgi:N-acetylneuraminate synthase